MEKVGCMGSNINTKEYWDQRFSTGDWERRGGRWQTESFALGQVPYLEIERDFEGTILDFGCGLGDAMPIYRQHFPKAKLVGVDISANAVELCRKNHGTIAAFLQGDYKSIPTADVIIVSNVLEHLSDDIDAAKSLLSRCKDLYVFVPYQEAPLHPEHVNFYDEKYYQSLGRYDWKVFPCKGWSLYGPSLWYHVYFKNLFRVFSRRQFLRRSMQIMFHFKNEESR
jgi:SAM-dependent methyltransferase